MILKRFVNEQLIDYNIFDESFTNGIHQNLTDFEVDMATIVPLI